jgi:KaiC/GvpD/RAD55 family RecA-like ATPase
MHRYQTGVEAIDRVFGGFQPGTNILVLAPPFSLGEELVRAFARPENGEYAIFLTTDEQVMDLIKSLNSCYQDINRVGVIDAITKSSSPQSADSVAIKYVSSPSDLTGIGIKFTQISEAIFSGKFPSDNTGVFPPPVRFCVQSLSTLLMFRKLEVLYQFLHVLSAKLKKMEAMGVYIINSESFDEKTLSIIKQLMTVIVEVRAGETGPQMRIRASSGAGIDWLSFRFEDSRLVVGT